MYLLREFQNTRELKHIKKSYHGLRYVVSSSQHGLKKKHIVATFRNGNTVNLGSDDSHRLKNVNSLVWIFWMNINWLVFLKPLVYGIFLLTLSELARRFRCTLPKALNSNLTRPFNGPFSKISTRSVDRPLTFKVARYADLSWSTASYFVNQPLLIAEFGT